MEKSYHFLIKKLREQEPHTNEVSKSWHSFRLWICYKPRLFSFAWALSTIKNRSDAKATGKQTPFVRECLTFSFLTILKYRLWLDFMPSFVYLCNTKFFFTKTLADVIHDIPRWGFIPWPYTLERTTWNTKEVVALADYTMSYFFFPEEVLPPEGKGQKQTSPHCNSLAAGPFEQDLGLESHLRLRRCSWCKDTTPIAFHSSLKPCDVSEDSLLERHQ